MTTAVPVSSTAEIAGLSWFTRAILEKNTKNSAWVWIITLVLASIVALLAAKYFGLVWMDPVVGVIGAVLVARWSYGLLGATSAVLLDRQAPEPLRQQVRHAIEAHGDTRVTDLHVWSIGPEIYSAQIAAVAHDPLSPADYKALIPASLGLVHVAVEVHVCPADQRLT